MLRASVFVFQCLVFETTVFERRTSTGSERFSLFKCLYTTKSVLLSVFTLTETICPNICSKSWLKSAKSPLPVDVRRSKTSLLKLPIDSLESFILPFYTRKVSTVNFSEGGYTLSRSQNDKTSNTDNLFSPLRHSR